MTRTSLAIRLDSVSISDIEKLFLKIIYPNKYEYTSKHTKMYYFENEMIWVTCELSNWDLLESGLYYTYLRILYKKNLKNSIDYISNLIDLLNEYQIKVHLECEEQDDNGNVAIDEFIISSKDDLLKLR